MGRLRKLLGSEVIVDFQSSEITIKQLLDKLFEDFPNTKSKVYFEEQLNKNLIILKNQHSVLLSQGLNTIIVANDEISIEQITVLETVGGG